MGMAPATKGTQMLRQSVLLFLLVFVLASCASGGPFRKRLVFERDELQQKIESKFPLKKKKAVLTATFSNPKVMLSEGADRLGIALDVTISLPLGKKYRGRTEVDGEIQYNPAKGEFSVVNSQVRKLDIEKLPEKYEDPLQGLAEKVVEMYLSDVPVYKLDQSGFKHSLAKLMLKSVQVEDGQLVVIIGI